MVNGAVPPTGAAGGDLAGTYPNPTVAKINGTAFTLPVSIANGGTGQAARTAPAASRPANPNSTVSTTLVMMGLAIPFTPTGSGNVLIVAVGVCDTATGATTLTLGGRYGTGTAPVNGAAVTGTRFSGATDQSHRPATTTNGNGFALTDVLALTPNTAYWFDIALDTSAAADAASVTSLSVSIAELP